LNEAAGRLARAASSRTVPGVGPLQAVRRQRSEHASRNGVAQRLVLRARLEKRVPGSPFGVVRRGMRLRPLRFFGLTVEFNLSRSGGLSQEASYPTGGAWGRGG
jgi:hypothetical protein